VCCSHVLAYRFLEDSAAATRIQAFVRGYRAKRKHTEARESMRASSTRVVHVWLLLCRLQQAISGHKANSRMTRQKERSILVLQRRVRIFLRRSACRQRKLELQEHCKSAVLGIQTMSSDSQVIVHYTRAHEDELVLLTTESQHGSDTEGTR
jgi:hypothetical protein